MLNLKYVVLTTIVVFAFTHYRAQAGRTPKDTFAIVDINDTIVPIFKVRFCEDWHSPRMFPIIAVTDEGIILIAKDSSHVMAMDTTGKCLRVFERPRGTLLSMKCHSFSQDIELMILTSKTRATVYRSSYDSIEWRSIRTTTVKDPSQMERTYLSRKAYDISFDQLRRLRPDLHSSDISGGLVFADSSLSIWRRVRYRCAYIIDHRDCVIYRSSGIWQPDSVSSTSDACFSITPWSGFIWLHQTHLSAAVSRNRKYVIWASAFKYDLTVGRLTSPALSDQIRM